MISPWSVFSPEANAKPEDVLGPYNSSEYLLQGSDIEMLRIKAGQRVAPRERPFVEPWKKPIFDLLNEIILSYLEHFIIPATTSEMTVAAAEALFPKHKDPKLSLDKFLYTNMTEAQLEPIPDFDTASVGDRVAEFLMSRCARNFLAIDLDFIAKVSRCAAYLVLETFELANNVGLDCNRNKIVPCDIRICVFNDHELQDIFRYYKVFGKGMPQSERRS
jgi:hypothetical protein